MIQYFLYIAVAFIAIFLFHTCNIIGAVLSFLLGKIKVRLLTALVLIGLFVFKLGHISIMNYFIVFLFIIIIIRLLIKQHELNKSTLSEDKKLGYKEYEKSVTEVWNRIFSFVIAGTFLVNLSYIIFVKILKTDEIFGSAGLFLIMDGLGFRIVKYILLLVPLVIFISAWRRTNNLWYYYNKHSKKDAMKYSQSTYSMSEYFNNLFNIKEFATYDNTDIIHKKVKVILIKYIFDRQVTETKVEDITNEFLIFAALNISDKNEMKRKLMENTGIEEAFAQTILSKIKGN